MTTAHSDPYAKTDAEREAFGSILELEEIEFEAPDKIGGRIGVSFTSDELDGLFAAAKLAQEDEISFIRQAALARIASLLGGEADASDHQPAAS